MVVEVFLDGGFEFGDAFEDAASDAFGSDAHEEALDLVEPRRRCWGEVHMKTGMLLEPRLNLGVLVCGVIVGNQMHVKPLGLTSMDDMRAELGPLVEKVWHYFDSTGVRGRTVTLKVKFADFQIIT